MGVRVLCHCCGSSIDLGCTGGLRLGCSGKMHFGGSCGLCMQLVGLVDGGVVDESASSYKEHYE